MNTSDNYRIILKYLWDVEIAQLNDVFPKDLLSLATLRSMNQPRYELRSGETVDVDPSELDSLCTIVPWLLHENVLLPFVFQKRKNYWKFIGSKMEQWIIDHVLGFTTCSPFLMESYHPKHYYHQHQVYSFKRKYPSLTILTFTYG